MKLADQLIEQEVEAVMEQGRRIPPAPDVVRARLLARARAAFAASEASPNPGAVLSTPTAWRGRRIAVAASVLLVFVAAAAAAAFHARVASAPETTRTPPLVPDPPAVRASATSAPRTQPSEPVSSTRTQRPRRSITPQESYAAELQLLQRAQSEYASHDFSNALVLLAEHGRRFPKGRLAEEREALRVRSLARAGRGDEARRALAAFANRFQHSAFLPRLQAAARSGEE
jgi:hypothetical protein